MHFFKRFFHVGKNTNILWDDSLFLSLIVCWYYPVQKLFVFTLQAANKLPFWHQGVSHGQSGSDQTFAIGPKACRSSRIEQMLLGKAPWVKFQSQPKLKEFQPQITKQIRIQIIALRILYIWRHTRKLRLEPFFTPRKKGVLQRGVRVWIFSSSILAQW